jgi:hypothetical protein
MDKKKKCADARIETRKKSMNDPWTRREHVFIGWLLCVQCNVDTIIIETFESLYLIQQAVFTRWNVVAWNLLCTLSFPQELCSDQLTTQLIDSYLKIYLMNQAEEIILLIPVMLHQFKPYVIVRKCPYSMMILSGVVLELIWFINQWSCRFWCSHLQLLAFLQMTQQV